MSEQHYHFGNVRELVNSISTLLAHEKDAERFIGEYTEFMLARRGEEWGPDKCRQVCLQNVGYCAGYIGMDAIRAVNRLLGATHIAYGAGT